MEVMKVQTFKFDIIVLLVIKCLTSPLTNNFILLITDKTEILLKVALNTDKTDCHVIESDVKYPYLYKLHDLYSIFQKPYDFQKYQLADVTESFEARMFASMKRQNEDAMEDVVPSPRKTSPTKGPSINVPFEGEGNRVLYDFSPQATSDEDSTWQAPVSSL